MEGVSVVVKSLGVGAVLDVVVVAIIAMFCAGLEVWTVDHVRG
jgi:hypothetical protein